MDHLKVALPAHGAGFAPIQYAADAGLYRNNGVDVEIVQLEGGPACGAALLAGDVDFTVALGPLIRAAMQDGTRGFKAISGLKKHIEFSIVAHPRFHSLGDLAGKDLESPHSDWSGGTYLRYLLRKLGFEGKIRLLFNYVTQEQRLAALLKGECEAGLLAGEKIHAAGERGFKVLLDFAEALPELSSSGLATTPKVIAEKREALVRMLRSLRHAVQEIKNSEEKCVGFLERRFNMPRATAEAFHRRNSDSFFLGLETASVQKEIDISNEMLGLRSLRAEEIVDLSLLREAV